ncbi:hypothetical protein ANN_18643 [Periplaneta americana]|uniref:Uncharacterized protein n=1 Tax=Periplaneta americana TaxID=6978 RepID=A0ABQ8SPB5_PERAM|nr:hypothetical protein ANN_18643 [Periplaneta americana]
MKTIQSSLITTGKAPLERREERNRKVVVETSAEWNEIMRSYRSKPSPFQVVNIEQDDLYNVKGAIDEFFLKILRPAVKLKDARIFCSNIKHVRAAVDEETIQSFFTHFKKEIESVPAHLAYKYDETNLVDDPDKKKVLKKRGCKYPEAIKNSTKAAVSIMICGNAAGCFASICQLQVRTIVDNMDRGWASAHPLQEITLRIKMFLQLQRAERTNQEKKKLESDSESEAGESEISYVSESSLNVSEDLIEDVPMEDVPLNGHDYIPKPGDFVPVEYEGESWPGRVKSTKNDGAYVNCMARCGLSWKWPEKEDCIFYPNKDIKFPINPPSKMSTKRALYRVPQLEDRWGKPLK